MQCIAGWATTARADVVELTNGGRVHGKVIREPNAQKPTYEIVIDGGGRMAIAKAEVKRVVAQTADQEEYARRARAAGDSVNEHLKLAAWCRTKNLRDEYRQQMARVLELDPNHEQARRALGFQNKNGQWMSRDEVMEGRGLVLYDGKYQTRQHVELLEQAKQGKLVDADWKNQLKRWRRWLTGRRADRSAEAHQAILAIRDPAAAPPLADMLLEEEDPAVQELLIGVAAQLDHPRAIDVLVQLSLTDPNPDTRHDCLQHLVQSGRPGLARPYIRALKDPDNDIVNRAADALEMIGDRDAIGPLIDALVTKHTVVTGGGSPDQHSYTFTPSGGTAMNFGGGGAKAVTQSVENQAVLTALNKLSGANFSYDKDAWRNWLAAEVKAHPVDVRRDF
jgi:hypothetical protein